MRSRPVHLLLCLGALLGCAAATLGGTACSTDETQNVEPAGAGGEGGALGCSDGCRAEHADGQGLYDALHTCLYCTECFTDCVGKTRGCDAPEQQGSCDGKNVCQDTDTDPDDDCATCALAGPCQESLDACKASPACVALVLCLEPC